MSHPSATASPLTDLNRYFYLIVKEPTKLLFDGTGFQGLPQQPINPRVLKKLLLSDGVSPATVDAVWRDLVGRARRPKPEGHEWTVVAIGVAVPGLKRAAGALAYGWHGDTSDIDAAMLDAFAHRLATIDLDAPRVLGKLLDAAIRAGAKARALEGDSNTIRVDQSWSRAPTRPWDHPDWVLQRAVAAGVIDRTEARLIGDTHLEDQPLSQVAAALRLDTRLACDWRWKASVRLRAAIQAGELDYVRARPNMAARRRALQLALAKLARAQRRQALASAVSG